MREGCGWELFLRSTFCFGCCLGLYHISNCTTRDPSNLYTFNHFYVVSNWRHIKPLPLIDITFPLRDILSLMIETNISRRSSPANLYSTMYVRIHKYSVVLLRTVTVLTRSSPLKELNLVMVRDKQNSSNLNLTLLPSAISWPARNKTIIMIIIIWLFLFCPLYYITVCMDMRGNSKLVHDQNRDRKSFKPAWQSERQFVCGAALPALPRFCVSTSTCTYLYNTYWIHTMAHMCRKADHLPWRSLTG